VRRIEGSDTKEGEGRIEGSDNKRKGRNDVRRRRLRSA
jgi:hypothetical protein